MEETKHTANETAQPETVNLQVLLRPLWQHRKVFYWVLPITLVVSYLLILCVPQYYTCSVKLAPETQHAGSSGTLQALASSFGFDMQNMTNEDALRPQIYPDIISSPNFLITLFDTHVSTADGTFDGTYYTYLSKRNRGPFWDRWKIVIRSWLAPASKEVVLPANRKTDNGVDVFCLNKQQTSVVQSMQSNIQCTIDKKTDIITFTIKAQDPLVSAIMADSVCTALQTFVTDYRTKKNRTDLHYYEGVLREAYQEYHNASQLYVSYIDSHSNIKLERYRIEAQNLETEMQLKHSAYTSFQKQYLATQARLQENTPVYTVLQSASIPQKPAGPRRMLFVLAMLVLAMAVTSCVVCRNELKEILL